MRKIENLQEEEFKILCKFKGYCDKHKLRYFLEGGTLLGAVRHKGFIPWDDDIDTIMPRQDYERFQELVKNEPISSELILINRQKKAEFRSPYSKICNINTILYEGCRLEETGIFIDVFPLDGAANSKIKIKLGYRIMDAVKVLENYAWMTKEELLNFPLHKKLRAVVCRKLGKEFFRNWLDKYYRKYPCGSTKYVSQVAWSTKLVYDLTEEYLTQTQLEFEGEMFSVPSCYDKRLTMMYGNYMQLPPIDKRYSKHSIKAFWKD